MFNAADFVYSEEEINSVNAMLNYRAASQQYFEYNTDNPDNSIMSEADRDDG